MTKLKSQIEEYLALDAKRTQGKMFYDNEGDFIALGERGDIKSLVADMRGVGANLDVESNGLFFTAAINQSADFVRKLLVAIKIIEESGNTERLGELFHE